MPIITVEGPPISNLEERRRFVNDLTAAATKTYNMPKESIIVLIRENSPDQVAVGGELICDKQS